MNSEKVGSILLVDDDTSWQNINKIILRKYGYRMDTASTMDEALDRIAKYDYEIAVVDLRLVDDEQSNFDGIEIIKALRHKSPNTRILVKSGYLSPAAEAELRNLGVHEENVFDKATTNRELVDRINRIYQELKHQ